MITQFQTILYIKHDTATVAVLVSALCYFHGLALAQAVSDRDSCIAAVWGAPTWGHVVSSDLAYWQRLPIALEPDAVYDNNGVFSGSATVVNGTPILLYTGEAFLSVAAAF